MPLHMAAPQKGGEALGQYRSQPLSVRQLDGVTWHACILLGWIDSCHAELRSPQRLVAR
jgi:hypothetical protein